MTLTEAKRLISWAQKRGIKAMQVGDISVSFQDGPFVPKVRKARGAALPADEKASGLPEPKPEPTLEQINAYIYEAQNAGHG